MDGCILTVVKLKDKYLVLYRHHVAKFSTCAVTGMQAQVICGLLVPSSVLFSTNTLLFNGVKMFTHTFIEIAFDLRSLYVTRMF